MEAPTPTPNQPLGVLFICMGNICRSPLAEALFIHLADQRRVLNRFKIDSAGTGNWHAGDPADHRTIAVGQKYSVPVRSIARQIRPQDWTDFHYLLVMDETNHRSVRRAGAPEDRLHYLRAFDPALQNITDPKQLAVPDPYHSGLDAFDLIYHQIHAACMGLLDHLLTR